MTGTHFYRSRSRERRPAGAPPAEIARRAIEGARPGSIICMHTEWTTQKAIPAMVKGLRAKGLEPVGLDELFRAAGLL